MTYLVVVDTTPDNKIAKMQEYLTRAEANAHVVRVLPKYPNAFVVDNYVKHRKAFETVDMVAKTLTYDSVGDTAFTKMQDWKTGLAHSKPKRGREDHITDVLKGVAGSPEEQKLYDAKIKIRGERP